jgi:hypothetical protein
MTVLQCARPRCCVTIEPYGYYSAFKRHEGESVDSGSFVEEHKS